MNKINWKYYVGLTAAVFVSHYFSEPLERMVVDGSPFAWVFLFIYYIISLAILDHFVLNKFLNLRK